MARKPRIEFPGALYHVIARGNHRQTLFHDDADATIYLGRLEHYRQRYNVTLYAYVLMSNHVHLLLQSRHTPLSKIMLVEPGRQRAWVGARAMLVYLGREWGGVRASDLGRQLHRDASMISRLYARYAASRDMKAEARLARAIEH